MCGLNRFAVLCDIILFYPLLRYPYVPTSLFSSSFPVVRPFASADDWIVLRATSSIRYHSIAFATTRNLRRRGRRIGPSSFGPRRHRGRSQSRRRRRLDNDRHSRTFASRRRLLLHLRRSTQRSLPRGPRGRPRRVRRVRLVRRRRSISRGVVLVVVGGGRRASSSSSYFYVGGWVDGTKFWRVMIFQDFWKRIPNPLYICV